MSGRLGNYSKKALKNNQTKLSRACTYFQAKVEYAKITSNALLVSP